MNCERRRAALTALADGRCEGAEARELSAHLGACADCRAELRWIRAMKASLSGLPAPAMPPDLKAGLMARARDAQAAKRKRAWNRRWEAVVDLLRPRPGLGLAAGLAAAVLAFSLRPAAGPGDEEVSLEELLAAHRAYAMSMPLSSRETGAPGSGDVLAGEP